MKTKLILAVVGSLISTTAVAQIYECIDKRGNRSYSESPNGKNCKISNTSAGSFSVIESYHPPVEPPHVNEMENLNSKRGDSSNVKNARKNLEDAQKALEEGKKIRLGNERNYTFYLKRIQGLEENVQARQQELNNALKQQE